MHVQCSTRARPFVPGAPLGPRPLEDLEVPVRGSLCARHFVPGAPVGPRPLKDLEVPECCSLLESEGPAILIEQKITNTFSSKN